MPRVNNWASIVLAAGKGTRMKSELPKVMHKLLGRPMIFWVLELLSGVGINRNIVVIGYKADMVSEHLMDFTCQTVVQDEQLGTGHAVMCTKSVLGRFDGNILIICGDTPLFRRDTILSFMKRHAESNSKLSVLTAVMKDASGYGRIIHPHSVEDSICGIVEEKDASELEKDIKEVNTGVYAINSAILFRLLDMVRPENAQREYYLTDIVRFAVLHGEMIRAICCASSDEALGVNSKDDLIKAEAIMSARC